MKKEPAFFSWFVVLFFFVSSSHAIPSNWETHCMKLPSFSKKYRIEFKEGRKLHYTERVFEDSECKKPWSDYSVHTTYNLNDSKKNSSLTQIDYVVKSAFLTPYGQDTAKKFRGEKFCNMGEWTSQTPQDVSGGLCQNNYPAHGALIYYSYTIQENKLYIGKLSKELNGTKPELRPKDLLLEMPFYAEDNL